MTQSVALDQWRGVALLLALVSHGVYLTDRVHGAELGSHAGRALTWLGQRTYSIYLWQQPPTICGHLPTMLHSFGAFGSALVGGLSFRWLEQPFLSARRRRVAEPSRRQIAPVALATGITACALAIPAAAAPRSEVIVFVRTIGDRQALYAVRPDGSGLRLLTARGRSEGEPVVSPDGRLIAAVGAGIVIRSPNGRLVRRIRLRGGGSVTDLSWSPRGRWIAYLSERCEGDGGRGTAPACADLWLVRPDGRVRRRLVEANVSTLDLVRQYAWSPSGRSIVFERAGKPGLAIVDVATGSIRTLRGTVRFGSRDPDWSRSGWIAFARQRGPFRGSDLYVVRPNGRGLRRTCRAESAEQPVYAPEGWQLAFLDYRPTPGGNRWLVRVLRPGGRCRTVGVATEEWTLRWSPDGTRLLWETWNERLMIGRADGRGRPMFLTAGSTADWH